MSFVISVVDSEGQEWKLCAPDCHPAIFAKGESFVTNASADELADVVMNAALGLGLDPSERGGWEQVWHALHGGRANSGDRGLAEALGLTFVFSGQKLVYLPCVRGDLGERRGNLGEWRGDLGERGSGDTRK